MYKRDLIFVAYVAYNLKRFRAWEIKATSSVNLQYLIWADLKATDKLSAYYRDLFILLYIIGCCHYALLRYMNEFLSHFAPTPKNILVLKIVILKHHEFLQCYHFW